MGIQPEKAQRKQSEVLSWTITLLILAAVMAVFAFLRLSSNPMAFPAALLLFSLLQLFRIVRKYRDFSMWSFVFEVALLIVLLCGVYIWDLHIHPAYWSLLLLFLLCSKFKSMSERWR